MTDNFVKNKARKYNHVIMPIFEFMSFTIAINN